MLIPLEKRIAYRNKYGLRADGGHGVCAVPVLELHPLPELDFRRAEQATGVVRTKKSAMSNLVEIR